MKIIYQENGSSGLGINPIPAALSVSFLFPGNYVQSWLSPLFSLVPRPLYIFVQPLNIAALFVCFLIKEAAQQKEDLGK